MKLWYGYARFNPIYNDHYAMRGEPGDHNGPTVFATHSTHKLLNALSQASYIHVREGRGAVNFSRFNRAYMMHATTSPLYAICASNDVAVSMMDGNSGLSLTQEVIDEAVDFRRAMARLYKRIHRRGRLVLQTVEQRGGHRSTNRQNLRLRGCSDPTADHRPELLGDAPG